MDTVFSSASYALNPWAIPPGLLALCLFIASLRTLILPRRLLAQTIGATWASCAAVWFASAAFAYSARDADVALFWSKLGTVACIVLVPLALDFADAFLGRQPKSGLAQTAIWLFATLLSLVAGFTDLILSGVNRFFWGFYPKFGSLGLVLVGFALAGFALVSYKYLFAQHVQPPSRTERLRIKIVRTGVLVANFSAVDLLAAFGFEVYPFGWLGALGVMLCAEYSQSKHGLWKVEHSRQASQILEAIDEVVLVVEEDFDVYFANRAARELFGCFQSEDFSLAQATDGALNENIHRRILGGQSMPLLETSMKGPKQEERTYAISSSVARDMDGRPVGVIYMFRDTTAFTKSQQTVQSMQGSLIDIHRKARDEAEARLKLVEDKLVHVAKIEALGLLAGGVAHDFNNILTAILGGCDLALNRLGKDHSARHEVLRIREAGEQGAQITQQLLAYSRKQPMSARVFDVNRAVSDATRLLQSLIPENIEIAVIGEAKDAHAKGEPGQIIQVIINLAINARDAMPNGGRLTVRTENVTKIAQGDLTAKQCNYIAIRVSDTGFGMDSRTLSRIFDPFFTTKEPGRGTGLGLSTAYGMARQVGGEILVESELGKGSTFHVLLPVVEADSSAQVSPLPLVRERTDGWRKILVVEDNSAVRKILAEGLAEAGYGVLEASGGDEASRILRAESKQIALVLTDVIMPGMGGRELAAHITARHPDVKVIAMSGYLGMHDMEDLDQYVSGVLAKPFGQDKLLATVQSVLFDSGEGGGWGSPPRSNPHGPVAIA